MPRHGLALSGPGDPRDRPPEPDDRSRDAGAARRGRLRPPPGHARQRFCGAPRRGSPTWRGAPRSSPWRRRTPRARRAAHTPTRRQLSRARPEPPPWWSERIAMGHGDRPALRMIDACGGRWLRLDLSDPRAPFVGPEAPTPGSSASPQSRETAQAWAWPLFSRLFATMGGGRRSTPAPWDAPASQRPAPTLMPMHARSSRIQTDTQRSQT